MMDTPRRRRIAALGSNSFDKEHYPTNITPEVTGHSIWRRVEVVLGDPRHVPFADLLHRPQICLLSAAIVCPMSV